MKKNIIFTNKKAVFLLIFIILFAASCRLDIPVKEMAKAKLNISRAEEVKASKYAPEELKKAGEELIKAHDKMKTEDVKEAKKAAEESIKYSDAAISKSLPLLADDTLKEARAIFEEADSADAAKYAEGDFSLAGTKIQESETLFKNTEYWESYNKSIEAMNYAISARDKALVNASTLRERMQGIQAEVEDLKSHGADEYAQEEMQTIEANLTDADKSINDNNLKDASDKISAAEDALNTASVKTWKAYASAKLEAAESAASQIENSPAKEANADDFSRAGAIIAESKSLFEKESFRESAAKSEEAIGILDAIKINAEKAALAEEKAGEEIPAEGVSAETSEIAGLVSEYIVKYNPKNRDCLWRIAEYTYKDARLWPLIYIANKDKIKDPDLIFPGQKFAIPPIPKKVPEMQIENSNK